MELAKQFVELQETDGLKLFYLWGHSFEFDADDNWEVIEKFGEYIGWREDIWYATNGEIYEYLEACKLLQTSMDGTFLKNCSGVEIFIMKNGKQYKIPAGESLRLMND